MIYINHINERTVCKKGFISPCSWKNSYFPRWCEFYIHSTLKDRNL